MSRNTRSKILQLKLTLALFQYHFSHCIYWWKTNWIRCNISAFHAWEQTDNQVLCFLAYASQKRASFSLRTVIYCILAQRYPDSVTSSHVRDNQNSCSISCSLDLVHADGWLNLCCILAKFLDLAWSYWTRIEEEPERNVKHRHTHTHTQSTPS